MHPPFYRRKALFMPFIVSFPSSLFLLGVICWGGKVLGFKGVQYFREPPNYNAPPFIASLHLSLFPSLGPM